MRNIVAVVPAAGLSTRFGGDKLLHPYRGKPLAAHIADTLAAIEFRHRIAICPSNSGRAELFSPRGFQIVENDDPRRGLASSIALGARRATELGADRMLVCLADMPNITPAHLEALLEAEWDVVATGSDGTRGPPAVFGRSMFPTLCELTGDAGARPLLRNAGLVAAPPEMAKDFDRPADFG